MDAELRDDGSVLVPLDNGGKIVFIPTPEGGWKLYVSSFNLTLADMDRVRWGVGEAVRASRQTVTVVDLLNQDAA